MTINKSNLTNSGTVTGTGKTSVQRNSSNTVNGVELGDGQGDSSAAGSSVKGERNVKIGKDTVKTDIKDGQFSFDEANIKDVLGNLNLGNIGDIIGKGSKNGKVKVDVSSIMKISPKIFSDNPELEKNLSDSVDVGNVISKNSKSTDSGVTGNFDEWIRRRNNRGGSGGERGTPNMLREGGMGGNRGSFIDGALSGRIDPVALDLNGDGVKVEPILKAMKLPAPVFPFKLDGKEPSEWLSGKDGWLVLDGAGKDKKKNGKIDGVEEMFGNFGEGRVYETGFDRMKAILDSDKNGVFDGKDPLFVAVQVWQDKNSNGITDKGELSSLMKLGVSSISLKSPDLKYHDPAKLKKGQHPQESTMVMNGKTAKVADVWLKVSNMSDGISNTKLAPDNTSTGRLADTVPDKLPGSENSTALTTLSANLKSLESTMENQLA